MLCWDRAFLYKKFLTDEECDHIIDLAKDKLTKSMVADNDSGKSIESEIRTSSGMFLSKAQVINSPSLQVFLWLRRIPRAHFSGDNRALIRGSFHCLNLCPRREGEKNSFRISVNFLEHSCVNLSPSDYLEMLFPFLEKRTEASVRPVIRSPPCIKSEPQLS